MTWVLLDLESVPKDAIERLEGRVRFYADHNVDGAIVEVLRFIKYDVETARDIGAERQPDDFHFKRAYNSKRVLLTHDSDYLDNTQFPLSQTRGVVILNIDTSDTSKIARALEVVDTIFGSMSRGMQEKKIVVNSDYTITMIYRLQTETGLKEARARYRFDRNGEDVWMWED
jgi:predicted nuclease of predicted toxin-antitoxin system